MNFLTTFVKGIVVGIGGILPGLSGSVMLLILGLYEKCIGILSNVFKNFKKNVIFLIPLVLGFGVGILAFSRVIDFFLAEFEFYTRYLFFGLVVGTVPLFYRSVKKNGFAKRYYIVIAAAFAAGIFLFSFSGNIFPVVKNPNLLQSVLLGVAVAGSSIVPGVDSAVILSALGLYELYVSSLADFNLTILLPAGAGLIIGAFVISKIMDFFIRRFYITTFSIVFGMFLSIIPKILTDACTISSLGQLAVAIALVVFGFIVSFYFGDIKENNKKIKKLLKKQ